MSFRNPELLRTRVIQGGFIACLALIGGATGAVGDKIHNDRIADRITHCLGLAPQAAHVDPLLQFCLAAPDGSNGVPGSSVAEEFSLGSPTRQVAAVGENYRQTKDTDPGVEVGLIIGAVIGSAGTFLLRPGQRYTDESAPLAGSGPAASSSISPSGATAASRMLQDN